MEPTLEEQLITRTAMMASLTWFWPTLRARDSITISKETANTTFQEWTLTIWISLISSTIIQAQVTFSLFLLQHYYSKNEFSTSSFGLRDPLRGWCRNLCQGSLGTSLSRGEKWKLHQLCHGLRLLCGALQRQRRLWRDVSSAGTISHDILHFG